MKVLGIRTSAMAAALLYGQTHASSVLKPRQAAQITNSLLGLFKDILGAAGGAFPGDVDAWDIGANPNMCEVYMETTNGLNCYASVKCNDGLNEFNKDFGTWNVCFQGGRQYFTDPRIGDFSITFTGRDGVDGEGLTTPILQVKDIGDWAEIPVSDLAWTRQENIMCHGANCGRGPYICGYSHYDHTKGRTRRWSCGVPKRGMDFPGLDSDAPTNERGYRPGWCGVHVTQYQKPDPSKDQYSLEARIMDANQNEIGNSGGKQGANLFFGSKLPLPFIVRSKAIDEDPLEFEYDAVIWDSNNQDNHHCSVGAYDNGKREMDCGFTCN